MRWIAALLGLSLAACAGSADEASSVSSADLGAANTCGYDPAAAASPRALMNAPIATADDAGRRFDCLQSILASQHDGRAPFASLYSDITFAVATAIKAGRFEDAAWTARYLVAFAELYRVSFVAYVDGEAAPASWRIAFDAAKQKDTLVVQDVSLGVNAHVDHDLSHALFLVGIGQGATRDLRRRDHFRVNDILHENVNTALEALATKYAAVLGEAPPVVMNLLSEVYFRAVEAGRLKAWLDAIALTDTSSVVRRGVEDEIEESSKLVAEAVMVPSLDPALLAKLHAIEAGN